MAEVIKLYDRIPVSELILALSLLLVLGLVIVWQ